MSEESRLKTRDQRYAEVVYGQVTGVLKRDKREQEDYGRLANYLPALVKKAGLAQALSFAEAKCDAGGKQLLGDLQTTINKIGGRQIDLMDRSRKAELSEYLWLTRQVMTALHWYKRFAQSVLEVKNDG
jgi:CRISPR-associated protein Cmr5